jgi:addiction module RelE/StbE family toxin
MVRIRFTKQSLFDLKEIYDYISYDSKKYAQYQILKIRNSIKILKQYKFSGKIVEEYNDENIREIIEGNYRIIYKILGDDRIDIITIHHGARSLISRKL